MRISIRTVHAAGVGILLCSAPVLAQQAPKSPAGDAAITEMQQQQRANPSTPYVPNQNREAAVADTRDGDWMDARQWLVQAQAAMRAGDMGAANEFLERAQTRILSRSTPAALAAEPMRGERALQITAAREALQRRDGAEAMRQIDLTLAAR
ncbi:hypothetical protein KPL78_19385 [Roseomonas sp. HJA6]|uniref:DUF4398 domain-containing protein n=1 Tax=Roseomonas alba TaxID=2846776 RepID=A0ABS7ACK2_9PROT|nr:hypothetical protein [Neoroseomonas alba]MBW6400032.1 hypothetical protein [Neoroseomonas alba]